MATDTDLKKVKEEAAEAGADAGVKAVGETEVLLPEGEKPSEMTALQVLLGATPVRQQRRMVVTKRDGLPADLEVVLGSLTDAEFKRIGEEAEATSPGNANRAQRRNAAKGETETDNSLFLRLIVANALRDPEITSAVVQAHQAYTKEQVVQRVFLPGEIARLAEVVMDLSGWSDDAVVEAKN